MLCVRPESSTNVPADADMLPRTFSGTFVRHDDSDLETESEMPSLDTVIPKDQLKKLKAKDKKRQEVINELFYTERAHVRNLKVLHRVFLQPMLREPMYCDLANLLFPNLQQVISVHSTCKRTVICLMLNWPLLCDYDVHISHTRVGCISRKCKCFDIIFYRCSEQIFHNAEIHKCGSWRYKRPFAGQGKWRTL